MPLYEYECTQCRKHTEKIQKFSDAEITVCPHCGGKLERVITAPSVQFKGGGWFSDGYGNAKSGNTKSEGSGGDSSAASAATSSEAKSATPAPAPAASSTTSSEKK